MSASGSRAVPVTSGWNLPGHPPEEFIRVWQTSASLEEACSRLGMTKAAAKVRAHRYRKEHDVPLKEFPPEPVGGPVIDWDALAQYAEELESDADGGGDPSP